MTPPLVPVYNHDPCWHFYQTLFYQGWVHPSKTAQVNAVYVVPENEMATSYRGQRFINASNGYHQIRFHGTQRACSFGDNPFSLKPCHSQYCSLCGILRNSFKIDMAKTSGMFGRGIYSTSISSKADVYVKNHHVRSQNHVMLICRIISDRPQYLPLAQNGRTRPDYGFDSVEAMTQYQGGSVLYPETVVYSDAAIVPVGVIVYSRAGWQAP